MDPQSLYVQLGRLVESMPNLELSLGPDGFKWLGVASALVEEACGLADLVEFNHACGQLDSDMIQFRNDGRHTVKVIVFRALAKAELKAPLSVQGAFIPAGNSFDALVAVAKVFRAATRDVLVVDPYADEVLLNDFAASLPADVHLRILSDSASAYPTLAPAVSRWATQHGSSRPIAARLTAPRLLHDRVIIVDSADVWIVTQSFKDFARRSPGTISRIDSDTAKLKLDAFHALWAAAAPI